MDNKSPTWEKFEGMVAVIKFPTNGNERTSRHPSNYQDQWQLDSNSTTNDDIEVLDGRKERPRFLPDKKGQSAREHVNCRTPSTFVRFIDVYVQRGQDPYIQTRSDAINDAILLWIWVKKNFADPMAKIAVAEIRAQYLEQKNNHFEELLDRYTNLIDVSRRTKNVKDLHDIYEHLLNIENTIKTDGGEMVIRRWGGMVDRVKAILE